MKYAKKHSILEEHVAGTIKSLVELDLGLIPLLHDTVELDKMIAETISDFQMDAKIEIGSTVVTRPKRSHRARREEIELIREQVERIDPGEVDEVMPILFGSMTGEDVKACLESKSALALRYNSAKKELIKRQAATKSGDNSPAADEVNDRLREQVEVVPKIQRLSLDTANISQLVALPTQEILANVEGGEGEALLTKLRLSRPTKQETTTMQAWREKIMKKTGVERKSEMANLLSKKVDVRKDT